LKLSTVLTTGQFLAVTCVTERPGSLGHRFFTEEKGDAAMQKMLLIRLVHCEVDDRFNSESGVTQPIDDAKSLDLRAETHENSNFQRGKR